MQQICKASAPLEVTTEAIGVLLVISSRGGGGGGGAAVLRLPVTSRFGFYAGRIVTHINDVSSSVLFFLLVFGSCFFLGDGAASD